MDKLFVDFRKWRLESKGRNKPAPRYIFKENEIISTPYPRKVSSLWNATYLNLHPTHFAVAIGPDGQLIRLAGGMNPLPPGGYNIHYVDRQNRVTNIPRTEETTCDGFRVALEVVITYQVVDPIKAWEVQNPVETLTHFIQSDVKEFIRAHKYDEIMGDLDGHKITNDQVAIYIKEQHAGRYPISKLFMIVNVVIKEKSGDPRVIELREKQQISQRQFAAQSEMQRQNQELEKKVAEQEALIKKIKAESSVTQQDILQKMELQKIDLEKTRAEFQNRQDVTMRAMEALAQAFSSPAFLRDPQVADTVWKLFGSMGISPRKPVEAEAAESQPGQQAGPTQEPAGTPNTEEMDSLTNMLLGLLARKRF